MSQRVFRIALVGDRNPDIPDHQAIPLALDDAAAVMDLTLEYRWLATTAIAEGESLEPFDAIWAVPHSPYQNMQGALIAIRYARENALPFLGTCAGFQYAVLEYARHVLEWPDAAHAEVSDQGRVVIAPTACPLNNVEQVVELRSHTVAARAWGKTEIVALYNCSYQIAPSFIDALADQPLKVSGWDEEGAPRILEIPEHPFFVATLFQPERAALSGRPVPLVHELLRAIAR